MSGNYFDDLGVKAKMGRTFLPGEDKTPGASKLLVISHSLWQRQFNTDDIDVVGRLLF